MGHSGLAILELQRVYCLFQLQDVLFCVIVFFIEVFHVLLPLSKEILKLLYLGRKSGISLLLF